jgi:hypothetical protein
MTAPATQLHGCEHTHVDCIRRRKLANKKAQQSAEDSPRSNGRGATAAVDADGDESPTAARRPARRQKTVDLNAPAADLSIAPDHHQHHQQQQQQHQQRLAALGGAAAAAKSPVGMGPLGAGLPQSQAEFLRSLAPAYAHELGAASKPAFGLPSSQVEQLHITAFLHSCTGSSCCDCSRPHQQQGCMAAADSWCFT